MSRVLLVMRHAKSSWDRPVSDHERTLNRRGERDAPRMGRALQRRGWLPDRVLCSDATRTVETLGWVEDALGGPLPQVVTSDLYLAAPARMLEVIARHGGQAETLMVLAHNPGCEDLVARLTGETPRITTANVARIRTDATRWDELGRAGGRLEAVLRPKELSDAEG